MGAGVLLGLLKAGIQIPLESSRPKAIVTIEGSPLLLAIVATLLSHNPFQEITAVSTEKGIP